MIKAQADKGVMLPANSAYKSGKKRKNLDEIWERVKVGGERLMETESNLRLRFCFHVAIFFSLFTGCRALTAQTSGFPLTLCVLELIFHFSLQGCCSASSLPSLLISLCCVTRVTCTTSCTAWSDVPGICWWEEDRSYLCGMRKKIQYLHTVFLPNLSSALTLIDSFIVNIITHVSESSHSSPRWKKHLWNKHISTAI